jgi:Ca-activated chloride channel family protein
MGDGMSLLEVFHFIRPWWLLLLPLVVLLPWWWRRGRRPSGDWERVCDPHLLQWLSVRQADEQVHSGGSWLAAAALLICILALAGPSWQKLPDSSFTARDARIIVLDLSRSMLAEDLRPDRLTRARFRLADLLESTREGQTGMVSYGGDAYIVSPLTNDVNTIANLLPAMQPDIIPVAGSRADLALDLAASLLERAGLAHGEILLVSDSADSRDAAKARELRDKGIVTSVLAVGTTEGAPVPSAGGFVSDRAGNVVIARLERAALQAVAEAGGGHYSELGALDNEPVWSQESGTEFSRREDALGERWKDAGPWLVLLLLPLALAGFRRGLFFAMPLLILPAMFHAGPARADWWEDAWKTRDQQAYEALQSNDAEKAAALAEDPDLSGEAWYRSGEYGNAVKSWDGLHTADGHYNRGNALALMGEFDAAIAAYDEALSLDPDMEDALANRELLEKLKEQQEQEQTQNQDQDGESQDGESSDQQQEGDQSQQQQGEDGESSEQQEGEQQEGEQQEGETGEQQNEQSQRVEAWSEEDAQAMEQWLRRIPDDPGGLLRRKFRNQHQRRGAPDDEKESW